MGRQVRAGVQVAQRVPEQATATLKTCIRLTTLLIRSSHRICDLRGLSKGIRESPMVGVLHQQAANRRGDKISRNGEIGPGPYGGLKEIGTILPFTHHPGLHQLSIKVSPSETGCFRLFIKVGDRTELIRD